MTRRPFLLITNDDSIHAPGIKQLWEAVSGFADVAIVAPHHEKSGCGLSITWTKPLQLRPFVWEGNTPAWSINGTPADCVKMACSVLLERKPDMVLSGINRGSNAGRTVLYSGTVGGVIEAAHKNIPGIAFSYCDFDPPPLSASKETIVALVRHFLEHPLPHGTLLNVNFPHNTAQGIKGIRLAKQGHGYWVEAPERRLHPEGAPYYWLGGKWCPNEKEDPESDVALLEQGFVACVPIQIHQLTDFETFQKQKTLFEKRLEQPYLATDNR